MTSTAAERYSAIYVRDPIGFPDLELDAAVEHLDALVASVTGAGEAALWARSVLNGARRLLAAEVSDRLRVRFAETIDAAEAHANGADDAR